MEHWQVLKLMVVGLWSENVQDEICQKKKLMVAWASTRATH
jgi:hypothetical protein